MYDNLDLTLYKDNCINTDFLQVVPQHLTKVTNHGVNQFGEYVSGYLESLKVNVSANKVKVYNSSICKYYLGDNFKTLSKGDTKRAIEKISDCLHVPIDLANVTRIDIAHNIIMKYPESLYLSYLGESRYYNRLPQNNGLYYNNKLRQLLFYGKVHEQKIKKQPIPELYQNRNVLRYEMRFKKRLREQLKQPQITAGLLSNEVFYSSLVKMWQSEYFSIQKINSKLINMKPTGSTKELIESMALLQVLEMGQPQILNIIKEWHKKKFITKKQAQYHRNKLKELSKIPLNNKSNELINELDKKIKEAANNW